MWVWRKMERISSRDRTTNEEVLKRLGEHRTIINTIIL